MSSMSRKSLSPIPNNMSVFIHHHEGSKSAPHSEQLIWLTYLINSKSLIYSNTKSQISQFLKEPYCLSIYVYLSFHITLSHEKNYIRGSISGFEHSKVPPVSVYPLVVPLNIYLIPIRQRWKGERNEQVTMLNFAAWK